MINKNNISIIIFFTINFIIVIPLVIIFNYYVIRVLISRKIDNNHKLIKYIREYKNKQVSNDSNEIQIPQYIKKNMLFYSIYVLILIILNIIFFYKYRTHYFNLFKEFNFIKICLFLIIDIILIFLYIYIQSNFIIYNYYNHLINKYKILDL
jgi:hypothetical protein